MSDVCGEKELENGAKGSEAFLGRRRSSGTEWQDWFPLLLHLPIGSTLKTAALRVPRVIFKQENVSSVLQERTFVLFESSDY